MNQKVLAYRNRRAQADTLSSDSPRVLIQSMPNLHAQRAELIAGLLAAEAHVSPKYFYDSQGCALFGAICTLEEYYPTRTEAHIFERHRTAIARALPMRAQWIDLGCGDGAKSRQWLAATDIARYAGVDIAQEWLEGTVAAMAYSFPQVECVGVVTDFTQAFSLRALLAERPHNPPVFFYPGSSIGNFTPQDALALLRRLHTQLHEHGSAGKLLIGVDLVKQQSILEAAYDDALGVTAAFNRNLLRVANRLCDADFKPERFTHEAFFNREHSRIEMHLRANETHTVRIDGHLRDFAEGETILTEYSHKYTPQSFAALLGEAGFAQPQYWTDEQGWFGVFLAGVNA
jgi:dimethylhistidine N-methyltransferase